MHVDCNMLLLSKLTVRVTSAIVQWQGTGSTHPSTVLIWLALCPAGFQLQQQLLYHRSHKPDLPRQRHPRSPARLGPMMIHLYMWCVSSNQSVAQLAFKVTGRSYNCTAVSSVQLTELQTQHIIASPAAELLNQTACPVFCCPGLCVAPPLHWSCPHWLSLYCCHDTTWGQVSCSAPAAA